MSGPAQFTSRLHRRTHTRMGSSRKSWSGRSICRGGRLTTHKVAQLDDQPGHPEKHSEQQSYHGQPRRRMKIFVGIIAENRAAENRGEKLEADRGEAPE